MSDDYFSKTHKNHVKRGFKRAHYDKETIYRILDTAGFAHIAYVIDGDPYCTPTCYWREGDTLYWHGSSASRMINNLRQGVAACVTISHLDGFVLARSGFHHSVNYRSAMCFGTAKLIEDTEQKRNALNAMINRFFPDRSNELRDAKEKELKATSVIAMEIESAAAKIRAEGVNDDEEDYDSRVWAGVIPLTTIIGDYIPDSHLDGSIKPAQTLSIWRAGALLDQTLLTAQQLHEKSARPAK